MSDLKGVYAAPTEETALNELELFRDKWDEKYPKIYKSWHDNWATLSTYFKYPEAVRRLIYTTNAIEGFNRQLRKCADENLGHSVFDMNGVNICALKTTSFSPISGAGIHP